MNENVARMKNARRYELVAATLRSNIVSGRLHPGLVLLEGPIASLMKTSRAPVQAALRILAGLRPDGHWRRGSGARRAWASGPGNVDRSPVSRRMSASANVTER